MSFVLTIAAFVLSGTASASLPGPLLSQDGIKWGVESTSAELRSFVLAHWERQHDIRCADELDGYYKPSERDQYIVAREAGSRKLMAVFRLVGGLDLNSFPTLNRGAIPDWAYDPSRILDLGFYPDPGLDEVRTGRVLVGLTAVAIHYARSIGVKGFYVTVKPGERDHYLALGLVRIGPSFQFLPWRYPYYPMLFVIEDLISRGGEYWGSVEAILATLEE